MLKKLSVLLCIGWLCGGALCGTIEEFVLNMHRGKRLGYKVIPDELNRCSEADLFDYKDLAGRNLLLIAWDLGEQEIVDFVSKRAFSRGNFSFYFAKDNEGMNIISRVLLHYDEKILENVLKSFCDLRVHKNGEDTTLEDGERFLAYMVIGQEMRAKFEFLFALAKSVEQKMIRDIAWADSLLV
jgi:hypothetical protein